VAPSAEERPAAAGALFRIVREPVAGGAELLTVLGRSDAGLSGDTTADDSVPLVSVLRDTLGDDLADNDRLRYVWVHGYATPSAKQRVASAIPFLNRRAGNKAVSEDVAAAPPVIDLGSPARDVWKHVMWVAAQSMLFDPYGAIVKTSVRTFRRNGNDYRKAHIIRALAVLSLYEAETGADPVLSPVEMRDIQARLVLAQKTFGGIVNDAYLQRAYERDAAQTLDVRGHNWELLRQRVEAAGLYFEPLSLPDGGATHALVWVARRDVDEASVGRQSERRFDKRFLNIATPWGDTRLRTWTGYSETRYFDGDGRQVASGTTGAEPVEMIPLAIYGLDHPKIPVVLVDFRDHGNPKRREVSRRVLHDITRNVLSLSPYGDIQYFLGRTVYDFVTGRRGMDINQPSRLRSYSLLKLLLSLDASLDPALAAQTDRLLERVSMNPLQNDREVEDDLARASYSALLDAAREPSGGLARALARDRRAEFARLEHGRTARILLRTATVVTAGIYRHREDDPQEAQLARLDLARRHAHHRRFLAEVVASTPVIEVAWDIELIRRSLAFMAEHGGPADHPSVQVVAAVFEHTADREARRLCLDGLAQSRTPAARDALARLYRSIDGDPEMRALALEYLPGMPRPAAAVATPASND
jgi:hypothetical protein